jgi:acetylornithine deacetylase/succinyl-diaminopimelate desuccinylase-like protein
VHLAAAVAKAGTWDTPARLNETTRTFFERLATISAPEEAAWYRNVLDSRVQEELKHKKPQYYSMVRTSIVPTMLKAGYKSNVIPPSAEATLDVRALPDEDLGKFRETLAEFINDPQVKVVAEDVSFSMPAAPPSKLSTEMFAALERAQKEVSPEAITLPTMTTGATDSSFLRAKGVQAYGIGVPKTEEENRGVHGNDERIETKQLARMSHRGGGERRKGARSGDGGRSRSRNHRNGPSSTVLLAVLAPRVAIFCQGKTHHSPDLLCCPMALGTCSLQQRRAATCNCRCT